jgi:hypothetical protein
VKRRIRWIGLAAILLLILFGVGVWLLPSRDGLLDHATLLTSTKDWNSGTLSNVSGLSYYWLNDHEVLYPHQEAGGSIRFYRKTVFPPGNPQSPTPTNSSLPASVTVMGISPDRNSLNYFTFKARRKPNGQDTFTSMLLTLKDGKRTKLSNDWIEDRFWAADSKGFVVIQSFPAFTIQIRNMETKKVHDYRFHSPPMRLPMRTDVPLFMEDSGRVVCVENGLHFLPQRASQPIGIPLSFMNAKQMTFSEMNINQTQIPVRSWSLPVPQDATQGHIVPSPQHDRLLWEFDTENVPRLDLAIHKVFPQYKVHWHTIERWQTSRMDGKDRKSIARFEMPQGYRGSAPSLQWTPDGKHLSFIYHNALYIAPTQ